ncbi:4'-phosphopantetheinyl transferase [Candidatus Vecturithrix granuli]|uniref:4'-phosphopantetheinyl transferase n=1 Tax=Vecturithrix granuli TaxID=1499967 RepID=A0A081C718_VECG1|nr:4'-phosphopantetheinyl transferase [Candidatus Vecturithrix granuli]
MNTFEPLWVFPREHPVLTQDEVHIWRVALDMPASNLQQFSEILADDERLRADRFRFPQHRNHFIAARGALRTLLGRYSGMPPEKLRFEYNQYGKPALSGNLNASLLQFNLSHSGELALYAFVRNCEVGIDIEYTRRRIDQIEQIARRYFSDTETTALSALPEHLRQQAFFNCWTRKEAYIKARGKGLSLPLHQFDVTLAPGEPARLLATRDDPSQLAHWTMQALQPGPDYIGAIVIEGHNWNVKCWQFL